MRFYILFVALVGIAVADINLKPARRHDFLSRRSSELFLTNNVELTYAQDVGAHVSGNAFKSHFRLEADEPILLLEDFDHLFEDVKCTGEIMTITVLNSHTYKNAKTECESLTGGILISSHFSCSEDGQHSFYRVLALEFDDSTSSIMFELEHRAFEETFHSVTFHLGQSSERHTVHQHDRLFKRQLSPASVTHSAVASTTASADAAEGTHETTMPLNFSNTNSSFAEFLNLPIEFGCNNCSASGELVLTAVDLVLYSPFNATDDDNDDDPVQSGSLQFDLRGFNLNIDLRAVPSKEFEKDIEIFSTPRFGFNSGIFQAGIDFGVALAFEVRTLGNVELGFGFDVAVPDSTLRIDLAETQNSGITGLDQTKVTPQLLSANTSNVNVSLSAGLKPSISFGITIGIVNLDAGPYMELPRLNLTASQRGTNDTGANCETDGDTAEEFQNAFQNLTHVQYNVGMVAGLEAEVAFWDFKTDLLSTQFPVATQCLVWQSEGTSAQFTPATAVLASMTAPPSTALPSSTAAGGAAKKGAGVETYGPPFGLLGIIVIGMNVLLALLVF